MIADYMHIPAVTPRRVIEEIDHRLEVIAGGGGAHGSEVKRLREDRRRGNPRSIAGG